MNTISLKISILSIVFLCSIKHGASQEIEMDQTSYTTGVKQVTTKMTRFDENLIFRLAAFKKKETSSVLFFMDIKVMNNNVTKYIDKGDMIYIVFKGGTAFWAVNKGESQKSDLLMGASIEVPTENWFELGFDDGSGAEIVEFRIENKTGLKIYSYPITSAGSKKFYACTKLLTDRIYAR